jgi:carbon-monoxide dehydrogenase medium subunit
MATFDYLEPRSLKEACGLLDKHLDEAKLVAGGTALVIWMRLGLIHPTVIVSLEKIPDFNYIRYDERDGLRIGAGARHREIELSRVVRERYPLLHETFRKVAQPRIRNMGTIGGNLCQGDPLTDPGASLIALDAEVTLKSGTGERALPLEQFFIDYYQTDLSAGEILTEIHVPPPPKKLGWGHIKFLPRSQEDFATVGVAIALKGNKGRCEDLRLALNSVAPVIRRATRAEGVLRGKAVTDDLLREMGEVASTEVDPTDDNRGSAEYKREMVKVLVRRAAKEALDRM